MSLYENDHDAEKDVTQTGKLKLGDITRRSTKHHIRSISVVSSCISGEDEEDWRGVWKDVDVVRHETHTTPSGDHYIVYVIEVMASDGTHWQVQAASPLL